MTLPLLDILSGKVDLVDSCDLATLLCQQFLRCVFIEILDLLMPFVFVDGLSHQFPLFGMERRITSQHKIQPSFGHEETKRLGPHNVELLCILQDVFGSLVRGEVDPRWNACGSIPGILVFTSEVAKDLSVLTKTGES